MVGNRTRWQVGVLFGVLALGCNQGGDTPRRGAVSPGDENREQYVLSAEPNGAKGVKDVREGAKDGDEVVVIGRVGGAKNPIVKDHASFTIVDPSLTPCSEKEGDNCPTPWDYCCNTREDLARATLMVKFVDERGKTLAKDAQSLLGIQPLQTVVVQGHAQRDGDGNLTVVADKLFVRP
jgi:hypothetical protein